jgi:hypothetical protein
MVMKTENQVKECQEELEKLRDRKVRESWFKTYGNNCWRLYIITDRGKMVMTFCPDWNCPVVEHHDLSTE